MQSHVTVSELLSDNQELKDDLDEIKGMFNAFDNMAQSNDLIELD